MKLSFIAAALASAIALCEGSTKMVIGYFPNWLYANYPVENIPYTKYTHINYAFAVLNNADNVPSFPDDWAVETYLPKVVQLAHDSQTKVLLSVGGWTGSKRFSPMVASPESRKKFIDWNLNFIETYKIDGVDLDWEYPGKQAAGCNEFDDNDADNFLLLLKELRKALDEKYPDDHKEISMAVHVQPFIKSGVPMTDLKAFVPYFDHVNLMTYDMNGAWASTTGPNAPFKTQGQGAPFSFVDSIRDWKAAGVPGNKITAGLAFYGRSMKAQGEMSSRSQFQDSIAGTAPKGDSDDAYWNDPYCNKEPGGLSGIWKWSNLRKEGLLKDDFVTPGEGWQRHWDEVSQTPWLFNSESKNFISYDDPQSLNIKVEHALCEDLAGVMVWDIHQDNGELLDVVNKIHNPVPTTCANNLGLGNPESIVTEKVDIEQKNPIEQEVKEEEDDDKEYPTEDDDVQEEEQDIVTTSMTTASSEPTTAATTTITPAVVNGEQCTNSGEQKCVSSGKSGQWKTCNYNTWLVRECATGLVCFDGQDASSLYCGFPENNDLKAASLESQQQEVVISASDASSIPVATATASSFEPVAAASFESSVVAAASFESTVAAAPLESTVVAAASFQSSVVVAAASFESSIPVAAAAASIVPEASVSAEDQQILPENNNVVLAVEVAQPI